MTIVPRDFFVNKKKLTAHELQVRFAKVGWDLFYKRHAGDKPPKCPAIDLIADFEIRLENLRIMILGHVSPRVEGIFIARFEQLFSGYTFRGGRKVTSTESLLSAIILEPYDNKMRGMIHTVQNTLWGNNTWAVLLEKKTMQVIGLEYSDLHLNEKPKNTHDGDSIKGAIIKLKNQMIVQRIKRGVQKYHHEVLYKRNVGISKGVLNLVSATISSHGFNGWVGQCAGHPDLVNRIMEEPPKTNPATKLDMYAWCQSMLAKGVTSRAELLTEAAKEENMPSWCTVATNEKCVSPLSSVVASVDISTVPDDVLVRVHVMLMNCSLF